MSENIPIASELLRDLFAFLDQASGRGYKCDHHFTLTTAFLRQQRVETEPILEWLGEQGGGCDCEIMFNVAPQWEERVGYTPPDESSPTPPSTAPQTPQRRPQQARGNSKPAKPPVVAAGSAKKQPARAAALPTEDTAVIQALMDSAELQAVERAIGEAIHSSITPNPFGFQELLRFQRVFGFLGLTCAEIRSGLAQHRETLVRFGIALNEDRVKKDTFGEAPKLQPGEAIPQRSHSSGFGLDYYCFMHLVQRGDPTLALDFFTFRRIGSGKAFYRDLKSYYAEATTPS